MIISSRPIFESESTARPVLCYGVQTTKTATTTGATEAATASPSKQQQRKPSKGDVTDFDDTF